MTTAERIFRAAATALAVAAGVFLVVLVGMVAFAMISAGASNVPAPVEAPLVLPPEAARPVDHFLRNRALGGDPDRAAATYFLH